MTSSLPIKGGLCLLALLAAVQSPVPAVASGGMVLCDKPNAMGVSGARVDDPAQCAYFAHYAPDDKQPDPRIVANLHLSPGQSARSIALVVGIGKYKKADYNVIDANKDVDKLMPFLIDDQGFDEVIVLRDDQATRDNIRYFLRKYAMDRTNTYQGRVRFLFAYSGHGVPMQFFGDSHQPSSRDPSVGLALAAAQDDDDYDNLYGLNELRALFNDLAKNSFHFLALINACFGGDLFSLGMPGASEWETTGRGAWAFTAGPNDKVVYSAKNGPGSLFFETIIAGIKSGDADHDAHDATFGVAGSDPSLKGLVRLGALDGYLASAMRKAVNSGAVTPGNGEQHHWPGTVEPVNVRPEGAFFFFQNPPVVGASPTGTTFKAELRTTAVFAPSLNQIVAKIAPQQDDFEALRATAPTVRGIDVSHANGTVDWVKVAGQKIAFAYIKATQSDAFRDAMFSKNWAGAREAGVARGAYHTFSFCSDVAKQFAAIKQAVQPVAPADLPIAIDIELYPGQDKSNFGGLSTEAKCAAAAGNSAIRNNVSALLGMIKEAYQKTPVLYGNDYVLDTVLTKEVTGKASLWRVKYGLSDKAPPPPWTLWQYSENERVAGITGTVDINVLSKPAR